jgi:hypothetical protein
MDNVALELGDPRFPLGNVFLQLPYFALHLLNYLAKVALFEVKLPYSDLMLADSVLVSADLVLFLINLDCELIIFFLRLVVLPTDIMLQMSESLTQQVRYT